MSQAGTPRVGIVMGSDSDWPTMKAAAEALEEFGVPYEADVVSAHRMPEEMIAYGKQAAGRGLSAIIAGAGGAAHLPGMLAAVTPLPVIGVPVPLKYLDGMDSLLSIVQMPAGVPVATVAIGNARNAGLLAVRILAASEPELREKMERFQGTSPRRRAPRARSSAGSRAGPSASAEPRPLDDRAAVHDHRHARGGRALERVAVEDAELEPDRLRADVDRLVGEDPGSLGAAEHVDHIDLEGHLGQRGVAVLAEHVVGLGVDRDDPLAVLLQEPGDAVGGPARVAAEPDDGPGLALLEHEAQVVLVVPRRRVRRHPSSLTRAWAVQATEQ
jgi:5-(carboxyamino)imidazole ribonucleotide mutase